MKVSPVPKFFVNLMEIKKASVFTPHSASHLSSPYTPVWHTSPKWRENIFSDTILLSGQTSSVPKLFHAITPDHGRCQLWRQSMIWQHLIVLGLSIWSLQISELSADQKEMISCSPGFTLEDVFRCSLVESSPSVSHCRCFLSSSVYHCSMMKRWVEVQWYQLMPKTRGPVFKRTINKAVWKFCKKVFHRILFDLVNTLFKS